MSAYRTLRELIENDPESQRLFESFPADTQVGLQELRQDIHTREELQRLAEGLQKQESAR